MRKIIKVNYPKKKSRINLEELGDVSEPERYSMYQSLQDNLKIANRTTFLHRIIYVGEHTFDSYNEGTYLFNSIITKCNETYCLEKLSGFLLYYDKYIVHMVEGDEDNLNKHLGYLLNKKTDHYKNLGTIKLLIHISNINQRFFEDWIPFTGTPSKLLEKLDIQSDLQQSGRCIYNCIKKLYSLIGSYAEDISINEHHDKKHLELRTDSSIEFGPNKTFGTTSYGSNSSSQLSAKEYRFFLPEYELLDFIIKNTFTMKLEEYFGLYGIVPMRDIYKDRVWPVPHDFIPYDVFEKPYDCLTELPKDLRRRLSDRSPSSTHESTANFLSESKSMMDFQAEDYST